MHNEDMRDRLIDLLNDEIKKHFEYTPLDIVISTVDGLLENGVIAPPCKVGDIIFIADYSTKSVLNCEVLQINTTRYETRIWLNNAKCRLPFRSFSLSEFGKKVFSTKKKAEQALEEESQNEISIDKRTT